MHTATRRHALIGGVATLPSFSRVGAVTSANGSGAESVAMQFLESACQRLAYRSVSEGMPIVLSNGFRGVLTLWNLAFIDAFAAHGFRVITLDHFGVGQSTGERSYEPANMVRDAKDLIVERRSQDVDIGDWSLGCIVIGVVAHSRTGHASHHQHPVMATEQITAFIRNTRKVKV